LDRAEDSVHLRAISGVIDRKMNFQMGDQWGSIPQLQVRLGFPMIPFHNQQLVVNGRIGAKRESGFSTATVSEDHIDEMATIQPHGSHYFPVIPFEQSRWRGGCCRCGVRRYHLPGLKCGSQGGLETHLRKMMLEELQGRKSLR